jgi:signal transduction histidine kinase/ligand-binding sensor domain-containing protein
LRTSSISRKAILGVILFAVPAWALDPRRPLTEFPRDQWGIEQGFSFGAVYAIAQTSDGYLWIGTDRGLVRFDGKGFRILENKDAPSLPSGRVLGLIADSENNLWIRLAAEGLFRYRNGAVTDMLAGRDDRLIAMMYRRADGAPIFQSIRSTSFVYEHGVIKTIPLAARTAGTVTAVAETADRTLWYGTRDDGLYYLRRPEEGFLRTGLRSARINCLAPADGGELWIGMDTGISRWNQGHITKEGLPTAIRDVQALSMIQDREANIWIGTPKGLLRVASGVAAALDDHGRRPQSVNVLFEDREGNIWFGGAQGLERLCEDAFVTYSSIPPSENVAEDNGPLWSDPTGRLWFAPSTGGLSWRLDYTVQHIANQSLDKDVIYSIAGDRDEIWLGRQDGGLTRLRLEDTRAAQTYTKADGLAAGRVFCVHRSRDGAVWAGTIGGGVSRLKDGVVKGFTSVDGLASNSVTAIEEGSDGTMWFATTGGLSAFSHQKWRSYRGADGLPPHDITCLTADDRMLWIGTSQGLAFFRDGHITAVDEVPSMLYESIVGIAVAPAQAAYPATLWIATEQSVLRVSRERLLTGKVDGGDVRIFDAADGLRGTGNLKRHHSVVTDRFGRIWFSTNRGVAVVDPSELAKRSLPAIAHIQTAMADENILGAADELDGGGLIHVPASPHRVVFSYIGLCLADPSRVLFRYRLDGYDTAWGNPTPSREAAYTNLGPGPYRFRVMARNADGAWSPAETAAAISIAPQFWQTWRFLGLGVCILGAAAIGVFRLRTHQLTTELNMRFEERLRERNRIAQELHDTLLQGFLGACMKLEVALDRVPDQSPARSALEGVLGLMRRVIDEGRNTVRGLRPVETESEYLEDVFSRMPEEVGNPKGTEFRVVVDGKPRALNAALRDEAYRIGREAVVNAYKHSGATLIEVALEYAHHQFTLRVRDNGRGMDADVLRDGREGHWGLPGMRERAERIGARLTLWSGASAGTEVVFVVPNSIAYSTPPARRSENSGKKL